jgi:seryl-tRNA synthetase
MNAPLTAKDALRHEAQPTLPEDLAARLFAPLGADGLYARTGLYESVVEALTGFVRRYRPPGCEVFHFPPVMSRANLERSGYLKSFPHLLGCVSCLEGGEAEVRRTLARFVEGEAWSEDARVCDLVLTPASCYSVYPLAGARGATPAAGWRFEVGCECFRREPSTALDRLQSFRMREFVRIGSPEEIALFRDEWLKRAGGLAATLGLDWRLEAASDPFYGRGGKLMAASQKEQSLKLELLVPVLKDAPPTACMSFNDHRDHFGQTWDLRAADGQVSHTGCVAFGMDRLALALFAAHGLEIVAWPAGVRAALGL